MIRNWLKQLWRKLAPSVPLWKPLRDVEVMYDLRDNALWWSRKNIERDEPFFSMLPRGVRVWDIGCNCGVWSVLAALRGCEVHAFDISPKALWMLRQTAEANDLNITTHLAPITTQHGKTFRPVLTSHTEETLQPGDKPCLYFQEAMWRFGTPRLIKMDIQGEEAEFLDSTDWRMELDKRKIVWLLELHGALNVWPEMVWVGGIHYAYPANYNDLM